jgi:hypothetical protein
MEENGCYQENVSVAFSFFILMLQIIFVGDI